MDRQVPEGSASVLAAENRVAPYLQLLEIRLESVKKGDLKSSVAQALAEDLGAGDVTSAATVPEGARGRARIVQKQPGVVYGLDLVAEAMRQCGVEDVDNLVVEGQWREEVPADVVLASGPAAALRKSVV